MFILYHYLEQNLHFGLVLELLQVLSARSFLVAGFDTLNIPRSFSCGYTLQILICHDDTPQSQCFFDNGTQSADITTPANPRQSRRSWRVCVRNEMRVPEQTSRLNASSIRIDRDLQHPCNRPQQTATDCNRLQQNATECTTSQEKLSNSLSHRDLD